MDAQTVIAKRIALELRDGMLVNLGIGIPTQVANYVPAGIRVYFQSENGLIGTGPIPEQGMAHPLLTDAGGRPISALPGASTFDSAFRSWRSMRMIDHMMNQNTRPTRIVGLTAQTTLQK